MVYKLDEMRGEAPPPTDASPAKEMRWLNLHKLSSAFAQETMLAYFLSALEVRAKLIKQLQFGVHRTAPCSSQPGTGPACGVGLPRGLL
jgi:hypothetical protein